jgi:hypothetical protein
MSTPHATVDERAPLLPTTSPNGASFPERNQPAIGDSEAEDCLAIDVNKKLTKVDIAWRVIFTVFAGFLLAVTIKAIVDTEHTDVRLVLFLIYTVQETDLDVEFTLACHRKCIVRFGESS